MQELDQSRLANIKTNQFIEIRGDWLAGADMIIDQLSHLGVYMD